MPAGYDFNMYRNLRFPVLLLLISALFLVSCSEAPKPTAEKSKEPEKPASPVTGRFAFHQMFMSARTWSPDVQLLGLSSIDLQGVAKEAGKAGAWQATFVSPGRGKAKMYTYSVIEADGNLHKGVFSGLDESYSGPRGQAKPFNILALKTDSDQAYKTALEHATEYVKKNPNMPISFVLEMTTRFPDAAWRVVWGESVSTSNFSIFVDASTGKYLQTMR